MSLLFVGIDPETKGDDCPAVWVDAQALTFVLQGWKADEETRAETQKRSPLPDTEDVILIPARMLPLLRTACDEMEQAMANRTPASDVEAVR